jgi:hypothetical protein
MNQQAVAYPPIAQSSRTRESYRIARRVVFDVKGHSMDGTCERDRWVELIAKAIRDGWDGVCPYPSPNLKLRPWTPAELADNAA